MLLDFGINTPTGDFHKLGTPLLTNAVLQYRVLKVIWPALEVNYTYWPNGLNRGKNQVFLLPEIILGSIELHGRVTWSIGAGYQLWMPLSLLMNMILPQLRCLIPDK